MKTVFLSGAMRGIPREEGLAWRKLAASYLEKKFKTIHAYRGRELKETFTDPRGAVIRDLADIKNADIMLVNDTVAGASMIGTAMEVFYAFSLTKPIIIFGNAHEKDYFLNYHSHIRVSTLEDACEILNNLFE